MGRASGLISLVCSLALVGALWAMNARQVGPTSERAQQARSDAVEAVGQIGFQAAATALEGYHAEHGTFLGASLPPAYGTSVVRADALTYCLQAEIAGSIQHFNGPGGVPEAGPC